MEDIETKKGETVYTDAKSARNIGEGVVVMEASKGITITMPKPPKRTACFSPDLNGL